MAQNKIDRIENTVFVTAGERGDAVMLNALDSFESRFTFSSVLFYEDDLSPTQLRTSLSETLIHFPIISGRLKAHNNRDLSVVCSDQGIPFTTALSQESIQAYKNKNYAKARAIEFLDMLSPPKLIRHEQPLLSIKLTQMKGGGSVLGICFSHCLVDGYSFYYFLSSWSKVHRGYDFPKPCHNRILIEHKLKKNFVPRMPDCFCLANESILFERMFRFLIQKNRITGKIFYFSNGDTKKIKMNANGKADASRRISTNDALSAHLWRLLCGLTNKRDSANRKFLYIRDIRGISELNMPRTYFGNATMIHINEMTQGQLTDNTLPVVSSEFTSQVDELSCEKVYAHMQWLRYVLRSGQIHKATVNFNPFSGDVFFSNNMAIRGYKIDFGGGRPFHITTPIMPLNCHLFAVADPSGDGTDIHFQLLNQYMRKLERDEWQRKLYSNFS